MKDKHKPIFVAALGLVIIFILVFVGLNIKSASDFKRIKEKSLAALFDYLYVNNESKFAASIQEIIVDSLKNKPDFILSIHEYVDSINNHVALAFIEDTLYWNTFCNKNLDVFTILINQKNQVLAQGNLLTSKDSLRYEIVNYITNPQNDETLAEKRLKYIKNLGEIEVSYPHFHLSAQIIPDSSNGSTSWEKLFQSIDLILLSYEELRDEFSLQKFGKLFRSLELEKQLTVAEIYSIRILIFPTLDSWAPLPPPTFPIEKIDIELNEPEFNSAY